MANPEPVEPLLLPKYRHFRWAKHLPESVGGFGRGYMIAQATDGCPREPKCGFCYSYFDENYLPFRILSLEEIKRDFEAVYIEWKNLMPTYQKGEKVFIGDADPLARPTPEFIDILKFLYGFGPIRDTLKEAATYARADTVLKKEKDLGKLKEAGLTDLFMGVESGDDEVLKMINKGYNTETTRKAVRALQKQDYGVHLFVISGLGGKERTYEHTTATADLLNELEPDTVVISPLTLDARTPLGKANLIGEFNDLSREELIEEEACLVSGLDLEAAVRLEGCFGCGGIGAEGRLPEDRDWILSWLRDQAINSQHYKSCTLEPVGQGKRGFVCKVA